MDSGALHVPEEGTIWWYTPRFTDEQPESSIAGYRSSITSGNGRCTPILGSGLLESLVGSFRDIARQWAQTYRYPMAGDEREELPLVAQYLEVDQGEETFVRDKFCEALRAGVLRQYREISEDVAKGPIEQLISAAGAIRREQESRRAARDPCPSRSPRLPFHQSRQPARRCALRREEKPVVALCPRDDDGGGMADARSSSRRSTRRSSITSSAICAISIPSS